MPGSTGPSARQKYEVDDSFDAGGHAGLAQAIWLNKESGNSNYRSRESASAQQPKPTILALAKTCLPAASGAMGEPMQRGLARPLRRSVRAGLYGAVPARRAIQGAALDGYQALSILCWMASSPALSVLPCSGAGNPDLGSARSPCRKSPCAAALIQRRRRDRRLSASGRASPLTQIGILMLLCAVLRALRPGAASAPRPGS